MHFFIPLQLEILSLYQTEIEACVAYNSIFSSRFSVRSARGKEAMIHIRKLIAMCSAWLPTSRPSIEIFRESVAFVPPNQYKVKRGLC